LLAKLARYNSYTRCECPELGNAVGSNGTRISSCTGHGVGSDRACSRRLIPTPRKTTRTMDFLVKTHPRPLSWSYTDNTHRRLISFNHDIGAGHRR
jgi:hypothetical protein